MSRLTAKDLEILKARGINSLTTLRDDEVAEFAKPKTKTSKIKKPAKKAAKKHEWVGKKLHCSYGYNMTINNFAKIIEVSPSGKTVKCKMVHTITNGQEFGGNGKAKAGSKVHGPEFRLHVRNNNTWMAFVGSYPFIVQGNRKEQCSYRKGYFSFAHDGEYYENHWD